MLRGAQERQVSWVVREYGNAQSIPTAMLLSYLRQELQVRTLRGVLADYLLVLLKARLAAVFALQLVA